MNRGLLVIGAILLFLAGLFVYYGWVMLDSATTGSTSSSRLPENKLWEVPDFELTNCNGTTVTRTDLQGKVWVAAFIFTRCPGPCPLITQRMVEIQNALDAESDARLVSFTIDPAYDQPDVLLKYAETWKADSNRWYFLTSEDEDTVQDLTQALRVAAYREGTDASGVPNITHGTNLLLIDQSGWVRGIYSTEDPEVCSQVVAGINWLRDNRD